MVDFFIKLMTFTFGMCIGSFMNVCIYRLPISKSIVYPGSMCPTCGNPIRFYDNIPVFSYLWLRGKCRHCETPIPFRYPLVEIMGGFLALCVYMKFGLTIESLIYYALIASLLVITFIDIDHTMIPDIITLPGIPIGFLASMVLPSMKVIDSLLGILAGGGILYFVGWAYHLITKKEGMGGGDIKLLAMIGAFLGWKGVIFTVFIASTVGAATGILIMLRVNKDMKLAIPFGPFLSLGAIAYVFFGPELIYWYSGVLV
ncbi:MAG TPA: prepilin peptidase [Desulfobacterales bacterium]|nr:prepilin peptidase [Desulfobacterales bacterium]